MSHSRGVTQDKQLPPLLFGLGDLYLPRPWDQLIRLLVPAPLPLFCQGLGQTQRREVSASLPILEYSKSTETPLPFPLLWSSQLLPLHFLPVSESGQAWCQAGHETSRDTNLWGETARNLKVGPICPSLLPQYFRYLWKSICPASLSFPGSRLSTISHVPESLSPKKSEESHLHSHWVTHTGQNPKSCPFSWSQGLFETPSSCL